MPDGAQPGPAIVGRGVVTIPNLITLSRLCMVPLAVWLVLRRDLQWAFAVFVAAGLSDAIDGWLARRGAFSQLGTLLDPLADKILLTSMYVVLAAVGLLPDWLAILVVFRDLVIVGGVVLITLLGDTVVIAPMVISKVNTVLQLLLVALALCLAAFGFGVPLLMNVLIACVAGTTLLSGILYVRKGARG
jgi:cardiolipin synthase